MFTRIPATPSHGHVHPGVPLAGLHHVTAHRVHRHSVGVVDAEQTARVAGTQEGQQTPQASENVIQSITVAFLMQVRAEHFKGEEEEELQEERDAHH